MNKLVFVGLFVAATVYAVLANAGGSTPKRCTFTVPDMDLSGDTWYGPENWDWCRSDWQSSHRKAYGIDKDQWEGHGWDTPCDMKRPLGRLYAAFVALEESSANPTKDYKGNILQWGAWFAWSTIDDLDAKCGDDPIASCTCTKFLGIGNRFLRLFVPPYFYDQGVAERASTLIHEARHWDGPGHDEGSRDSSWSYNGAWRWEVAWLAWYAAEAIDAPLGQRCKAQDLANGYLKTSFKKKPGFTVNVLNCSGVSR